MPDDPIQHYLQLKNAYENAAAYNAPAATLNRIKTQKETAYLALSDEDKYIAYRHHAIEVSRLSHEAFDRQVVKAVGTDPKEKLAYTLLYLDTVASSLPIVLHPLDME